jgi:hypothetical protein
MMQGEWQYLRLKPAHVEEIGLRWWHVCQTGTRIVACFVVGVGSLDLSPFSVEDNLQFLAIFPPTTAPLQNIYHLYL